MDLKAMLEVRRRQENPELGAYRMRAALEQAGIYLSTRTVGRILAANREAEGLPKPKRSPRTKREMPFGTSHRHEIRTSDVRYVDHSVPEMGQAYVILILDNFSRAILASAVTLSQDTSAYLSVLHAAIERHGSPGTVVTDGAGVFKANRAKAVYRSLGIQKEEIERGRPWQSFHEKALSCQVADVAAAMLGRVASTRRPVSVLPFAVSSAPRSRPGCMMGFVTQGRRCYLISGLSEGRPSRSARHDPGGPSARLDKFDAYVSEGT